MGDGVGKKGCCVIKKRVGRDGSTSASKTEVKVRSFIFAKNNLRNKTLPKALKFSYCRKSIRRQIQPSYKKKCYDCVKCLHCLVLWKLRNLETWVNFRFEFTMFEKSNHVQKKLAQREKTQVRVCGHSVTQCK